MRIFYSKKGDALGRGYQIMPCWCGDIENPVKDHKPHNWNSHMLSFGPYMCPGSPEVELYDTPKRKPVNPQPKKKKPVKGFSELVDISPLGENVTDHTMGPGCTHDDGRVCSWHHRLGVWVTNDQTGHLTMKCHRHNGPIRPDWR